MAVESPNNSPAAVPPIERRSVEAGGLQFAVATCETQSSGGRLALCLHGFPETWRSWVHQIPCLAELGYRVWVPDLRGYGETTRPGQMQDYAVEKLMGDVAALIDAAEADSVGLVGHDWGGMIAWWFATRRLRELEKLVIMNVPHPEVFAQQMNPRQLLRSWYAMFFQLPWLPERVLTRRQPLRFVEKMVAGFQNPENVDAETRALLAQNFSERARVKAMLDYYRAVSRGGGARRQRKLGYPVIETPTLMLWGLDDVALGVETTYGTDAFVSDLTLRYLENASHFVQQDAPVLVNRLLSAWLRGDPVPDEGEAEGIRVRTRA